MKENVLDVLMYLFENYIYDEPDTPPDRSGFSAMRRFDVSALSPWVYRIFTGRHSRLTK